MAISLRLDTGRRTVVATATRLPRYARNDIRGQSKDSAAHAYPLYSTTNVRCRLTCTHFTPPPTGAAGSLVPALICHCEERPLIPSSSRDVAISLRLDTRRRTAVATATRLPRYARNDIRGQSKDSAAHAYPLYFTTNGRCRLTCTRFDLSLRGAPAHPELVEGRGNLVEVGHTSANRRCYGDEIAALRSQ